MKTGLLSDTKGTGLNIRDASRVQELDKKSRKIRKQQVDPRDRVDEYQSSQE